MPPPSSASVPGAAPQPDAPARPETVAVLGIPLARIDYERAMDWIDAMVASRGRGYVCVAATHLVMTSQEDPELRDAVLRADLVVPDGQPLVWAMNALGAALRSRVYGPTLMARYCERSARTGARAYLYGGRRDEGALGQLEMNLRRRYPELQIVGGQSAPFRVPGDEEAERIAGEINACGADVVWVGLGMPLQEKWMAAMRDRLDAPVLVGVGAAFDFHAGLVRQAPPWMQSQGLEWLFRLSQEPRRLWRRYARYNPRFVIGFARQWMRWRLGPLVATGKSRRRRGCD